MTTLCIKTDLRFICRIQSYAQALAHTSPYLC